MPTQPQNAPLNEARAKKLAEIIQNAADIATALKGDANGLHSALAADFTARAVNLPENLCSELDRLGGLSAGHSAKFSGLIGVYRLLEHHTFTDAVGKLVMNASMYDYDSEPEDTLKNALSKPELGGQQQLLSQAKDLVSVFENGCRIIADLSRTSEEDIAASAAGSLEEARSIPSFIQFYRHKILDPLRDAMVDISFTEIPVKGIDGYRGYKGEFSCNPR